MANKYYLCNNVLFLCGMGASCVSPSSGTHYKLSKAKGFIYAHPGYSYFKVRSSNKGNDYVICTQIKLVGANFAVIDDFHNAKIFNSPEDAYGFLDENRSQIDSDIVCVIDEKFNRIKRKTELLFIKPVEKFDFDNMDSSKRIVIPQHIRDHVYDKSNGICAICGKPISKYSYTIDHILPLSRGGTNVVENLRAVHGSCNKVKGNFTDDEMNILVRNIYQNNANNINSGVSMFRNMVRSLVRKYSDNF